MLIMLDIDNVMRYVAGFSKIPDKYGDFSREVVYSFNKPLSLAFLQTLFNVNPNHPDEGERYLIDPYEIDEVKAKALQPFIKEKLDLDKYQFQLHCCSNE